MRQNTNAKQEGDAAELARMIEDIDEMVFGKERRSYAVVRKDWSEPGEPESVASFVRLREEQFYLVCENIEIRQLPVIRRMFRRNGSRLFCENRKLPYPNAKERIAMIAVHEVRHHLQLDLGRKLKPLSLDAAHEIVDVLPRNFASFMAWMETKNPCLTKIADPHRRKHEIDAKIVEAIVLNFWRSHRPLGELKHIVCSQPHRHLPKGM